ncbi:MAG: hypothetical protein ACE5FI_13485, partial [Anaerolineales bacterium]
YLGGDDVVWQLLQQWRLARAEVGAGHIPLWNPYLFAGVPLLANPQPAFFYPPNWILFVAQLPLNVGLAWLSAFHLGWIALGMYLWARGADMRPSAASVAAATLAYSGFIAVRIADGHPNFVATLSWLPWAMIAARRLYQEPGWRAMIVGALPPAFALLAGNPAGALLVAGLPALWLVSELIQPNSRWRATGWWTASWFFAAGLTAVQLLPAAQLILRSTRVAGADAGFSAEFALPAPHLISLIIPNFFGEPVRTGYWGEGRHTEFILYPGLVALALATIAVRARGRNRRVRFWLGVAVVSLLLALGPVGGLHTLAVRLLPPLQLVRAPARFGYWSIFALAALAGMACEDGIAGLPKWVHRGALSLALAFAMAGFAAIAVFRVGGLPNPDRIYHLGSAVLRSALILALIGALFLWRAHRRPRARLFASAALFLTLMDLWGYGVPILRTTREEYDLTWREAAPQIESGGRVLPWGLFLFFQNGGMNYGIPSIFGYDPLVPADYDAFTDVVPDPRARTFDLLHARYLIAHADQDFGAAAQPSFIAAVGDYALFERAEYMPRAWVVSELVVVPAEEQPATVNGSQFNASETGVVAAAPDCPASSGKAEVTVLTDEPGRITMRVTAANPGILILSEQYYPGWRAIINGAPQATFPIDGVLIGTCVPAGQSAVRLAFAPLIVTVGALLTAITFLIGAVVYLRTNRAHAL